MITLTHADWSVSVSPELGAAVSRLTWLDRDILRPAPEAAASPLETGSFSLVPYANRIARGRFSFAGRDIVLPATAGFEPHALHGMGWLRPWRVRRAGSDVLDMVLAAERSADWPWAWHATHGLRLGAGGLTMTLAITNADTEPMPAGLGLHPYFAIEPQTVVTAPAPKVWANRADAIPERLVEAKDIVDWSEGAAVASAPFVDNAYADWSGMACLAHAGHEVRVAASTNARWLQIYAPDDTGFVCIEPVTHRPDAHNAPAGEDAGLVVLETGQTLSLSMRIDAAPIGDRP